VAYIPIDLTKPLGLELQTVSDMGVSTAYRLQQIYLVMTGMVSGTDYTAIETHFGVPAGTGQTVFECMENALTDMQNAANIQVAMASFAGRIRQLHPLNEA